MRKRKLRRVAGIDSEEYYLTMAEDFAKWAEAVAVAARRGVQVEILWQKKLEEDLRLKQLEEEPKTSSATH